MAPEVEVEQPYPQFERRYSAYTEEAAGGRGALINLDGDRQRLLEIIEKQQAQLRAAAARQRHLARQVVSVREEERRRVSRELHDEAGQGLTALKVSLEMILSNPVVEASPQLCKEINNALQLTEKTAAQIRSLAHKLRPAALDDLGLDPALEGFCREFSAGINLAVSYRGVPAAGLSKAGEICLYRILQEALTNVVKHARAGRVEVVLSCSGRYVSLTVEDDGVGFSPEERDLSRRKKSGIGLLGMQERLEPLGGRLEIASKPGRGTRLAAVLPCRIRDE